MMSRLSLKRVSFRLFFVFFSFNLCLALAVAFLAEKTAHSANSIAPALARLDASIAYLDALEQVGKVVSSSRLRSDLAAKQSASLAIDAPFHAFE